MRMELLLTFLLGGVAALDATPLAQTLLSHPLVTGTLLGWCESEIRRGDERALGESHRAAVVLAFAVGVSFTAVSVGLGLTALNRTVAHESLRLSRAWLVAQPLWLGLGLAQLLSAFVQRR